MKKKPKEIGGELSEKDLEPVSGGDTGPTRCPHAFLDCPNLPGGTCQWFGTSDCVNGYPSGGVPIPS